MKRASPRSGGRTEMEKVYDRLNDLSGRVVNLEAQRPHTDAALGRIEKSVERLNGHIIKAIWIILGLFITALWRVATTTGIPGI